MVYLLTTGDIFGNAGLKDATKGSVSLGGFLSLRLKSWCLNKVYESSASTFAINDQLKGLKRKRRSG